MAQNVGYAALQIIPSFDGFQGKLESGAGGSLIAAGRSGGQKYGDAAGKSLTSTFGRYTRRAALASVAGFAIAGAAAIKFGKDSVQGYEDHLRVVGLTRSTIKATGDAANVTTKQVSDLSDALEWKTGIDGDVIQSGANMLLTFKNIRNEAGAGNDIFNQSLSILTDLSAAMGTDAKSSAIQLGKALNDPLKGITALTRVGVTFDDQQKEQIKNYVEQGKSAEAQKIILRELNSEFGGAAKAQMDLGDRVTVAYHRIQDEVGQALLPTIRDFERFIIRKGVPAAERFSQWFRKDGVPAIHGFIDEIGPLVHSALPAAVTVFNDIKDAGKAALPFVKGVIDAFDGMPDWSQKAIVTGGAGAALGSKFGFSPLSVGRAASGSGGLLSGITKASPLPVVVVNPVPGITGAGSTTGGTVIAGGEKSPTTKGGKLRGIGNGVAAGAATVFGPWIVDQAIQEAMWPWTKEGPFGHNVGNAPKPDITESRKALEQLLLTPAEIEQQKRGLETLIGGTGQLGKAVGDLPPKVLTKISAPGVVETRQDAIKLARQYDLTPKQKATLFKVLGIPQAKDSTQSLIDVLSTAAQPRRGSIDIDTSAAQARADHLYATLNNINRLAAMHSAGVGPAAPSSRTRVPRRRSKQVLTLQVNDRQINAAFDERIATQQDLADERRRAGR